MVIYEVTLSIDSDIYSKFKSWLRLHVLEIIQFPGFIQASILKPEQNESLLQQKIIVQYQLNDRHSLDNYFAEFAPKMREEGLRCFGDKFSAERKIYEVLDTYKTPV